MSTLRQDGHLANRPLTRNVALTEWPQIGYGLKINKMMPIKKETRTRTRTYHKTVENWPLISNADRLTVTVCHALISRSVSIGRYKLRKINVKNYNELLRIVNVAKCYEMLQNVKFCKCYEMLSFVKFCKCYEMLQNVTKCKCNEMLRNVKKCKCYEMLRNVTKCCEMLQNENDSHYHFFENDSHYHQEKKELLLAI